MSPRKPKKQFEPVTTANQNSSFASNNNIIDWETKFNDTTNKYAELLNKYDALLVEHEKLQKKYIMTRKHLAEGEGRRK